MFRIVPIFFLFWGKEEKREETDGYGHLFIESPRGFADGKSCCRRGSKRNSFGSAWIGGLEVARPPSLAASNVLIGETSRSRCERCPLPRSHRDMKHPHLFVRIFILVAVVMFSPVKMSEYRRCYVDTHGLHVIAHISQFLDRLLEALDIIMRLIILPG